MCKKRELDDSCDHEKMRIPPSNAAKPPCVKTEDKKRQYSKSFLQYGFTCDTSADSPLPLCVICGETLSNAFMVPSKLKRHFEGKHSHLKDKSVDYFERLISNQKKDAAKFVKKVKVGERALEASFIVSEIIAKNLSAHTVGERLIKDPNNGGGGSGCRS